MINMRAGDLRRYFCAIIWYCGYISAFVVSSVGRRGRITAAIHLAASSLIDVAAMAGMVTMTWRADCVPALFCLN
jgi:hypothetical protein